MGILSFVQVTEQLGNRFASGQELSLGTQEVIDPEVIQSICQMQKARRELHKFDVLNILDVASVPILQIRFKQDLIGNKIFTLVILP